jgi:hypothetical protein
MDDCEKSRDTELVSDFAMLADGNWMSDEERD